MFKNVLSDLGGVGIYGVISVCLFFVLFTGAVVWAFRQKASFLNTMSGLPLDDGTPAEKAKGNSHE
jgi:hypothetical protein